MKKVLFLCTLFLLSNLYAGAISKDLSNRRISKTRKRNSSSPHFNEKQKIQLLASIRVALSDPTKQSEYDKNLAIFWSTWESLPGETQQMLSNKGIKKLGKKE